ncbi:MAG: NapC/NirT family cytochrome c [Actinobacteria bacterium]|nr:NapC/NirT family cytochrome c [Actinomycetota bacterium]
MLFLFLIAAFFTSQLIYIYSLNSNNFCKSCHLLRNYSNLFKLSPHSQLRCSVCHPGKGISNFIAGQINATRNLTSFLLGGKIKNGYFFDSKICLDCHPEVRKEVLKGKVRVRHKDFLKTTKNCTYCHGGIAHKLNERIYYKPSMFFCLDCHDDTFASSDCSICHTGRKKELLSKNLEIYGKFHPDNYINIHGAMKSKKCSVCHEEDYCANCHVLAKNLKIKIPHPDSWIYSHWEYTDRQNVSACYACHDKKRCDSCHGIEMPHRDNFLKLHASISKKFGTDNCLKCHDSRACAECHTKHVHPNFGTFWTPEKVFQKQKVR